MKLKKTTAGNYFFYYHGHYVFARRKPHGGFGCYIGKGGEWLHAEGNFAKSLKTVSDLKTWIKTKI